MLASILLTMVAYVHVVRGHGRLIEPPARNTMWRFGYNAPHNYEDTQNFCGGIKVQYEDNFGKCGVCGDAYSSPLPRAHETGGLYATNITVRTYRPGFLLDLYIDIVANHLGYFEFSLCNRNSFDVPEMEDCFHTLPIVDHNMETRMVVPNNNSGIFYARVQLPSDISCEACVLRWHWMSGNNWGTCPDGVDRMGCGPQEVYRNCADIAIKAGAGVRGPFYGNFNDLEMALLRKP